MRELVTLWLWKVIRLNQLDIIDISNVLSPKLIKTHPMDNPHGLSVRNSILYLCEGDFGLKIFNVEDSENIKQLAHDRNTVSYDVISLPNNTLLMIGKEGFIQYDVTNPSSPVRLSVISKD